MAEGRHPVETQSYYLQVTRATSAYISPGKANHVAKSTRPGCVIPKGRGRKPHYELDLVAEGWDHPSML